MKSKDGPDLALLLAPEGAGMGDEMHEDGEESYDDDEFNEYAALALDSSVDPEDRAKALKQAILACK